MKEIVECIEEKRKKPIHWVPEVLPRSCADGVTRVRETVKVAWAHSEGEREEPLEHLSDPIKMHFSPK